MKTSVICTLIFLATLTNYGQIGTKGLDYDDFFFSIRRQLKTLPDGEHKFFYETGELKTWIFVKNKKLDSIARAYYKSGRLKFIGNYDRGEREGTHYEYYADKTVESQMNFKNDSVIGSFKFFYPNGMLKFETYQKRQGKDIIGFSKAFILLTNRKKKLRNKRTNKIRIVKLPDTIRMIRFNHQKNYQLHGECTAYHSNGKIDMIHVYDQNEEVKVILYNEDGTKTVRNYKD